MSQAGAGQAFYCDLLTLINSPTRNSVPIFTNDKLRLRKLKTFALDDRAHQGQGWHSGSSTARSCLTPPEEGQLPSWPSSANTTLLRAWHVVGAQEDRAVAAVSAQPLLELCWNKEGKRKERCSL